MAKTQVATRLEEKIMDRIIFIEQNENVKRSDLLRRLIVTGLENPKGTLPQSNGTIDTAKNLLEKITKQKERIMQLENENATLKKSNDGFKHPLLNLIKTEGIMITMGGVEKKTKSPAEFLNYIEKQMK